MIKIQKLEKSKEPIGSFTFDCKFYSRGMVHGNSYERLVSQDIYQSIVKGIDSIEGFNPNGKMLALTYSVPANKKYWVNGYIIDGEISRGETDSYFYFQRYEGEYYLDVKNVVMTSGVVGDEFDIEVTVNVYEYILGNNIQTLSGELEIDDNTVPRPKEIYHDFGISDGQIKLDSSNRNQDFTSNSKELYAIIYRDRLFAVMGIKRLDEIVNDKIEKVLFTDQSDSLYEGEIVANIYNKKTMYFDLDSLHRELLNDRKMCDAITYSGSIYDSILRTVIRLEREDRIFLEQLVLREYLSLICEIYDSTVSIDNGALRFMAR